MDTTIGEFNVVSESKRRHVLRSESDASERMTGG